MPAGGEDLVELGGDRPRERGPGPQRDDDRVRPGVLRADLAVRDPRQHLDRGAELLGERPEVRGLDPVPDQAHPQRHPLGGEARRGPHHGPQALGATHVPQVQAAQLVVLAVGAVVLPRHPGEVRAVADHADRLDAALAQHLGEAGGGRDHRVGVRLPLRDQVVHRALGERDRAGAPVREGRDTCGRGIRHRVEERPVGPLGDPGLRRADARDHGGRDDAPGTAHLGDQVRPGVAHLHDQRHVPQRGQHPADEEGGDRGGGRDDDVGPVLRAGEAAAQAAQGVQCGHQVVGGAGRDVPAVGQVGGAQHGLAVHAALDGADLVRATLRGVRAAARVVRDGRGHRDAVPRRQEPADERRPATLRGAVLRGVVVGQQQDPHPAPSPGALPGTVTVMQSTDRSDSACRPVRGSIRAPRGAG